MKNLRGLHEYIFSRGRSHLPDTQIPRVIKDRLPIDVDQIFEKYATTILLHTIEPYYLLATNHVMST